MKESKFHIEQQDVIFYENFLDEQTVRRNSGVPTVGSGAVLPTFQYGECTFDGAYNYIEYPRTKLRLCEPERAFSMRTKVYLTDTDASVFLQLYLSGANLSHEIRFMIGGNWPVTANEDRLVLELWDSSNNAATEEVRGRRYNTALTTLAKDKWTEFVCTYDGRGGPTPEDGICLYMDGIRVDDTDFTYGPGSGAYSQMRYHSDLTVRIGQNVDGKMDILEVYNRVLTPEEVSNLAGV